MNTGRCGLTVVFLIDRLARGGTPGYVLTVLPLLQQRGQEVKLICLKDDGGLGGSLREIGIEVESLHLGKILSIKALREIFRLRKRYRKGERPVFVCHMFSSMLFGGLARLFGACSTLVLSWRDTGYWLDTKHFLALRWACRMSSGILANSSAVADAARHVAGKPFPEISVVYNGVKIPDEENSFTGEMPVIGCLARFSHVKGQDILLDALAELSRRGRSFRAIFGGDGETLQECRERCKKLELDGVVDFCGRVDAPDSFYRRINILAAPSRSEGFSNTVLEAMARGVPAVACAAGGMSEAVEDGRDGLLVEGENPLALADGLERLILDGGLRARLGKETRRSIIEKFSADRMADETLAVVQAFAQK